MKAQLILYGSILFIIVVIIASLLGLVPHLFIPLPAPAPTPIP